MRPRFFGQERMRDELDRDAAELQREKLTLAAEVIRRPEPTVVSFPAPEPVEVAPEPEETTWVEWEEEPPRRRAWKWAVGGFVLVAGAIGGAVFVPGVQELVATAVEAMQ